jgi:hypothetical protein
MFFVIAGIQPKTRTLDHLPQRCPRCGLHQAYTRQVDQYLSLFFIPLVRVRRGEPFLFCLRCNLPVGKDSGDRRDAPGAPQKHACSRCGRAVQAQYAYCPHCGQRQ